jgi:hypothetical protein
MLEYLDDKGEKIENGFYKYEEYNAWLYFTGKYDIEGFAIFEIEGTSKRRYSIYPNLVKQLSKINKEELKEIMKEAGEVTSWIEKKLKK